MAANNVTEVSRRSAISKVNRACLDCMVGAYLIKPLA